MDAILAGITVTIFIFGFIFSPMIIQSGILDNIKFFKRIKWRKQANKIFKEYNRNEDHEISIWYPLYYKDNWYYTFSRKYGQKVLDMPRLSFERWLIFYNNKPEVWVVEKDEDRLYANIPYYVREIQNSNKPYIFLPIFWESAKDMYKYRKWVEEEYQNGKAQIYSDKQDENFKQLVTFIEEDIKANHAQARRELEQVQKNIEKQKEPIKLQLSNGPEVIVDPGVVVNPNTVRTATPVQKAANNIKQYDNYITSINVDSTSFTPIKLISEINGDKVEELTDYRWEYYDCGKRIEGKLYYSENTKNYYKVVNGQLVEAEIYLKPQVTYETY